MIVVFIFDSFKNHVKDTQNKKKGRNDGQFKPYMYYIYKKLIIAYKTIHNKYLKRLSIK
jgi:hypothetical protein